MYVYPIKSAKPIIKNHFCSYYKSQEQVPTPFCMYAMYTNVISMPNLELLNHYIVINVCRQAIHMSFKTRTTKPNPLIFFKHSRPCKPMGNPVIDAIFYVKGTTLSISIYLMY